MSLWTKKVSSLKFKEQVKKVHLQEPRLNGLLDLAEASIKRIIDLQDKVIEQETLKIFLATGNKHKIEEISDIFSGIENIEILSIKDGIAIPEVIEDGKTLKKIQRKSNRNC